MKKIFTVSAVSFVALGAITQSCSSKDNDEVFTEKQDFTNENFIKSIMLGKWDRTHSKKNGNWIQDYDLPNTPKFISTYHFSADGSYTYKPYSAMDSNELNETGTYKISPATSSLNAKITFTYLLWNQTKTREIQLTSYSNGVVETSSSSLSSPGGIIYERFKKQ